uniref:Carbohydrate sulfotransferase n=1 Tax=Myotis lucifugus TaxID=59463 RepID=G1Q3D0_MYOLU
MGRRCWRRRALAAACLSAALLLLGAATRALLPESGNKALGSGWLGGKKRSPLQMLYDLDQTWEPESLNVNLQVPPSRLAVCPCSHTCQQSLCQSPSRKSHLFLAGTVTVGIEKETAHNTLHAPLQLQGPAEPGPQPVTSPPGPACSPRVLKFELGPGEVHRQRRNLLRRACSRYTRRQRLASAYAQVRAALQRAFQRLYGTRVRRLRPRPHPDALARGHDVRFAEFLYLLDPRTRRDEPFNEHWERAHALCHPCRLRYDVVGKFETLAEDAAFVLSLVGAPGLRFPAPPPRAKAAAAQDQARRLFQDISPFYQRRLFDLYKMDFLLFNYSAPSYLRLH